MIVLMTNHIMNQFVCRPDPHNEVTQTVNTSTNTAAGAPTSQLLSAPCTLHMYVVLLHTLQLSPTACGALCKQCFHYAAATASAAAASDGWLMAVMSLL